MNSARKKRRRLVSSSGRRSERIGHAVTWGSVSTDQATASRLQTNYLVSTMVNNLKGITLRIVSPTRPHEAAIAADPSLEEAYLVAVGRQPARA